MEGEGGVRGDERSIQNLNSYLFSRLSYLLKRRHLVFDSINYCICSVCKLQTKVKESDVPSVKKTDHFNQSLYGICIT